jgi:tetratricopeptide (TPR) repeat protein/CHAT domain-containing protein
MDWEEIILSALRNNEDIEITLKKVAQVAPKEIILAFENFPDDISEIRRNLSKYPKVVSLLFLHVLAAMGELFFTFPLKEQKNTLESAVDASLEASLIARDLGEKRLEASYLGTAANALYKLRRFSRAEKVYTEAVEKFRVLAEENPISIHDFAAILNNLGLLYTDLQKFSQAEKAYIEASDLYRALSDKDPKAYTSDAAMILVNLGGLYKNTQRFSQAEKAYIKALDMYEAVEAENPQVHAHQIALALNNLGVLYRDIHKFSQAEKAYKEALEIRRNLARKNPQVYIPYVATTLNNLGNLYIDIQKFSHAEKVFTEALKLYKALTKQNPEVYTPEVAKLLTNLGRLYWSTERFSHAEKVFTEALEIYKALTEQNPEAYAPYTATTLHNLGVLYRSIEQFYRAEKVLTEALEMYKILARRNPEVYEPDIAMTLNNLGVLYSTTNKFSQAEQVYTEVLDIYKALARKNPEVYTPLIVITLGNLGTSLLNTQKFSEVEGALTEAIEILRTLAEKSPEVYAPHIAVMLNSLGNLYSDTHKFSQAEMAYTEAVEMRKTLAKQNPDTHTPHVAMALGNLGTFYLSTQKFFESGQAYTEALEIYRALAEKNPEVYRHHVATILNFLGNLYMSTRKFSDAEKLYTEALEIRRGLASQNPEAHLYDVALTLNRLGTLYIGMQKFSEADYVFTEALKIYRALAKKNPEAHISQLATMLANLGTLYSNTQQFSQAEKVLTEALEKFKQKKLWFYTAMSIYNLFKIKSDTEILKSSRKILELGILFSKEEKYKYVQKGTNEPIYIDLLENDIDTFGILEALRDPQLLSLPWDNILSQQEIEKAQKDLEFQKVLVERMLKRQVQHREFTARIPDLYLFIYIQVVKGHLFFFAIEKDCIKKFRCEEDFFSTGKKLLYNLRIQQRAAQRMRDLTFATEKFERLSRRWCTTLPQELRRLILEKDCIVFSADYPCSFLPLEALQIDGQMLCMEKTMVRATSLHQFQTLLTRNPSFDSSLIIGNPWPESDTEHFVYSLPQPGSRPFLLSYLHGAEREAETLMKLHINLPRSTLFLRDDATGERFLSEISHHSLIHFSGHGSLGRILFLSGPLKGFPPSYEPEEFSQLRKAERIEGKRRVNMMEEWHPVTDLDLFDVRLRDGAIVFLNACETGQQKYAGGGYYQGLPAVFLKNGAFSVISSLVPIFDVSSKEFALQFYETLLNTHSVAESLKKARIWAKNEYNAQIYWVPYIHYGPPL